MSGESPNHGHGESPTDREPARTRGTLARDGGMGPTGSRNAPRPRSWQAPTVREIPAAPEPVAPRSPPPPQPRRVPVPPPAHSRHVPPPSYGESPDSAGESPSFPIHRPAPASPASYGESPAGGGESPY